MSPSIHPLICLEIIPTEFSGTDFPEKHMKNHNHISYGKMLPPSGLETASNLPWETHFPFFIRQQSKEQIVTTSKTRVKSVMALWHLSLRRQQDGGQKGRVAVAFMHCLCGFPKADKVEPLNERKILKKGLLDWTKEGPSRPLCITSPVMPIGKPVVSRKPTNMA